MESLVACARIVTACVVYVTAYHLGYFMGFNRSSTND